MRKFFKKIHLWLSLPTGLIISLICITGALLVFDDDFLEWYYPERYFVEQIKEKPIPLEQLIYIVNNKLDSNSVASVKIPTDPRRTYTMMLEKGFRISAFVNPYNGEITGIYEFREGNFYKIMSLHRWLMDGTRTWGKYTTGISTLLFSIIIISGIIIWIPKSRKKLKKRLVIKSNKGIKRLLTDLHVVVGIYVSLFLLTCSLTGPMWSFDWYRGCIYQLCGTELKEKKDSDQKNGKQKKDMDTQYWQTAIDNIEEKYSYATITKNTITVLPQHAMHERATDKYTFDPKTGTITDIKRYEDQELSSQISSWAYVLHVGSYGGIITKCLVFLASLLGASLPITGYYIYFRKKRKKRSKKQKLAYAE